MVCCIHRILLIGTVSRDYRATVFINNSLQYGLLKDILNFK